MKTCMFVELTYQILLVDTQNEIYIFPSVKDLKAHTEDKDRLPVCVL